MHNKDVCSLWQQSTVKEHCASQLVFVLAEKYVVVKVAKKSYTHRYASLKKPSEYQNMHNLQVLIIYISVSSSFATRVHLNKAFGIPETKICIFEPCQEIDILFEIKMPNTFLLLRS